MMEMMMMLRRLSVSSSAAVPAVSSMVRAALTKSTATTTMKKSNTLSTSTSSSFVRLMSTRVFSASSFSSSSSASFNAAETTAGATSASSSSSSSSTANNPTSARLIALNELHDNGGATQQRTRWGRGTGSGRGKRAGRGQKGSFARNSRGIHPWFIGGQTPLYKLLPKRGFKNPNARPLVPVNLDVIARFVENKRIDVSQTITMKTLLDAGVIGKKVLFGVKLLSGSNPELVLPKLQLEVTDCSKSAKELVEASGGSVKLVYHNRLSLRAHLHPERFVAPRTTVIPPPRLQRKYRDQQFGQSTTKPKAGEWA